jgi:hypothetical protein
MSSYENQFRAIVGDDFDPSQHLDGAKARALTALIFGMPDSQVLRDGKFIEYAGWCLDQNIYLAVTVTEDHKVGTDAFCEPHLPVDGDFTEDS